MKQFTHSIALILRGIGVLHRLTPWNLLAKCVRSLCNALLPFVNLIMSARIIDLLGAGNPLRELLLTVFLALTLNLGLVLLSKQMDAVNYRKWNQFYLRYRLSIGEKMQHLPYDRIESEQTHLMIKRIDDAMKIGNYGLIKLHSRIPLFAEHFLKVCLSVGLILAAVLQKSPEPLTGLTGFANSHFADTLLFLLVFASAGACIAANRRIASASYTQLGKLSKENRVFDYYMDQYLDGHKAGKDIRLYRQNQLITDELRQVSEKNAGIVSHLDGLTFRNQLWILLSGSICFCSPICM